MAKYLVYARALQVLKSNLASRSGSSFASWEYRGAAMLLRRPQPLGPWVWETGMERPW